MRARLANLWDSFRSSFWFVPSIMSLFAIALAMGTCQLDEMIASSNRELSWFSTTAEAARSTLSSVAGATIALAGVVFSITVLTLSIASSQFGSRLVRNVMSDSIADLVIGQYVGTSLYCMLVLQTVREGKNGTDVFTPQLGTAVGLILGLICMGMLILFIHHVATAIQAPTIVTAVARDLDLAVDRLFPERIGERPDEEEAKLSIEDLRAELSDNNITVASQAEGYIEGIDGESLVSLACEAEGVVELLCKPGDFVTREKLLARIWLPRDTEKTEDMTTSYTNSVNRVIIVGPRRTPRQDVGYAARELVEIALRALSPGINDPFTAMSCVDRLGGALGRLVERSVPVRIRRDDDSVARVLITEADDFPEVLIQSFGQIREYGASSTAVSLTILKALTEITNHASRPDDIHAIRGEAEALQTAYVDQHIVKQDLETFRSKYRQLSEILDQDKQS
ncbi:DUF2254 domain-containing protein [Gimesia chilikensis]|uniref:DUF2254 domain-containing protein n=1 Tax=Gimesia chilikensis TaxID=2605989 RepID=A0A517PK77_9PLAN|nr:DUF2254 domain-containing protein [Gimesia chilikensis]QDT19782.1 hypothetical protein HG66A1_15500 [Gimesia chilikensis]